MPNPWLATNQILDETPRFIDTFRGASKTILLAKIRHNRLVNVFLGLTAFSFERHLLATVGTIGQIEIDEVYVGVDRSGRQFVVPVQAKGGSDKLGATQAKQDIAYCEAKFPSLICRAVSAQFVENDLIALFELTLEKWGHQDRGRSALPARSGGSDLGGGFVQLPST